MTDGVHFRDSRRCRMYAGSLLGAALTGIYVAGIVQHRKRGALRMGLDSIAVIVTAAVGFFILYRLDPH